MAAPALYAPMTGDSWNEGIRIQGRPEPPPKEDTGAGWARVMPGFFETLGAKMLLGRSIHRRRYREHTQCRGGQRGLRQAVLQKPESDRAAFRNRSSPLCLHLRNRRRRQRHALHDVGLQRPRGAHVLGVGEADCAIRRSGLFRRREVFALPLQHRHLGPRRSSGHGRAGTQSDRQRRCKSCAQQRRSLQQSRQRRFSAAEYDCHADYSLRFTWAWYWLPSDYTA